MKETKKLTRIEEAILMLADYLEDEMHADYKIKQHIMEILGVELIKSNEQPKK